MRSRLTPTLAIVIGAGFTAVSPSSQAVTIDKFISVQAIQLCNDAGASCATVNTFAAETNKIYNQAGVGVVFLPTVQLNDSSLLNGSDGVPDTDVAGNGQHVNSQVINAWYTNSLAADPGKVLYGNAWVGANGVAVNASAVNAFNSGNGRRDTLAHEIGHNLGLGHSNFGAGGADNLLTSGSSRSVPGGVGAITPDGAGLSVLTQDQIDELLTSALVQTAPKVTVDTSGSTPFNTTDFFDISFDSAGAGVSMTSLTLDLGPVNAFFDISSAPPGAAGTPFGLSNLNGLLSTDITVTDGGGGTLNDGDTTLKLSFGAGAFTSGESFSFGLDIDLFSGIDAFGATPEQLVGMLFDFQFSNSFASTAVLDDDLITDSQAVLQIITPTSSPTNPGPTLPQGTVVNTLDPVSAPEPGSVLLLAAGVVALGMGRRKSRTAG